jgi:hypothetical protein
MRFDTISPDIRVMPVTLPPGRFKLPTSPNTTGSAPMVKTIGIADVAVVAARTEGTPPVAAITATRWRTKSAANSGNRS